MPFEAQVRAFTGAEFQIPRTASLFAVRTAALLSAICHINGPTVADEPQMLFGGVKASGYGRFDGRAAIAEFTDLRGIKIEGAQQHYPL